MSEPVTLSYDKVLTHEEQLIFDAGGRAEARRLAAWCDREATQIGDKWRAEGRNGPNAEGYCGHQRGLWDAAREARRAGRG